MKSIVLILIVAVLICSGCAGFQMDCWVGYRKISPEVGYQAFKMPAPLKFALTPAQIELILSFLGSEAFEKFIQGALPVNNSVGLGGGCLIKIE